MSDLVKRASNADTKKQGRVGHLRLRLIIIKLVSNVRFDKYTKIGLKQCVLQTDRKLNLQISFKTEKSQ